MLSMISGLIRAMKGPSTEERERNYLNGSHDLVDLELRQREIDRGRFRQTPLRYY